jgi:hydrogenase maturation protease
MASEVSPGPDVSGPGSSVSFPDILVIGCGNLLRGDDGVGPVLLRHLLDRGLPPGMEVADGGTSGMDVAFRMRGAGHVILVDACTSGGEPGTLYELPGEEVESPPLEALGNLHSFRWDHAISFGRWLLKDEYPRRVTAFLIEAATTDPGMELSEPVRRAMDRLIDLLLERFGSTAKASSRSPGTHSTDPE